MCRRALSSPAIARADVLGACAGWPGADRARRVVAFSNGLAESPLESRARVTFDAFGLPEPELQVLITAGVSFRPDGTFRVHEYHEYRVDFLLAGAHDSR